jgi:polysaccharide deacetylase 2 family uncharacterized protein YibQ
MAAPRQNDSYTTRSGGADGGSWGPWPWIGALVLLIGAGVAALFLAPDRVGSVLHTLLGSSDEGEIAASPKPRSSATHPAPAPGPEPATEKLAEMPALVGSQGAADSNPPSAWPDLGPGALLDQAAAAPDRALRDTAFDQPAFRRFARPFAVPEGRKLVGILVSGLGSDRAVTAAAISGLPADVTLSFSPYAPELSAWIAAARAFGHEAMVDLPLQSKDGHALGDLGLMTALNAAEAGRRMEAVAAAAGPVFGFAGDGGDALLLDDRAADVVLGESARRGLAFVDASGEPLSLAGSAAQTAGAAFGHAAITLDDTPAQDDSDRAAIRERLSVASQMAEHDGGVLLAARASPAVVSAIADWARRLGDQDPVIAPVSALLQKP